MKMYTQGELVDILGVVNDQRFNAMRLCIPIDKTAAPTYDGSDVIALEPEQHNAKLGGHTERGIADRPYD